MVVVEVAEEWKFSKNWQFENFLCALSPMARAFLP